MAAATTNIAVETGAAATMEATTAPSGVHNLHFISKHTTQSSKIVYASRRQKHNKIFLVFHIIIKILLNNQMRILIFFKSDSAHDCLHACHPTLTSTFIIMFTRVFSGMSSIMIDLLYFAKLLGFEQFYIN